MTGGCLKFLVLRELYLDELTGYDLLNRMEKITGKRPSSGSIYPLLKELKKEGFVKSKADGRKKIYSVTQKGVKVTKHILKEKEKLMQKQHQILCKCAKLPKIKNKFDLKSFNKMTKFVSNHQDFVLNNADLLKSFRVVMEDIVNQNDSKKEKEARMILKKAILELKKLNKK